MPPSLRIARRLLLAYFRSGWLLSTALVALALGLLLFWRPGGETYIFTTASFAYGVLAFATAALLTHELRASHTQRRLIRAVGQPVFLRGLALALGALEASIVVTLLATLAIFGRIQEANAGTFLAGAVGLLANCVALCVVAGVLMATMTQRLWIGALAWLVAGLWSFSASSPLSDVLFVARIPLIPVGTLYDAGATGDFGWRGALALLCVAGMVAAVVVFAPRLERDA